MRKGLEELMKKMVLGLLFLLSMMSLLAGCEAEKEAAKESTPEAIALTEVELAYFNGDSFFNGEYLNLRNQFLSSLYDNPAEVDLFELFYNGTNEEEATSEEEILAVMQQSGITGGIEELPCDCIKISRMNMEKVLTEHMGITLDDTNKVGLDQFVYLSQYDAYYHIHGDTNYRGIGLNFSKGERVGDTIRLSYDDTFYADGEKTVTLKEQDGTYLFIANQKG